LEKYKRRRKAMQQTGSQVLFKTLKEEKVDTLFGYPGGSVMDIYDEMFRQDIRHPGAAERSHRRRRFGPQAESFSW
jgi:hypothetical protein